MNEKWLSKPLGTHPAFIITLGVIAVIQSELINGVELSSVTRIDWHILNYCDVYKNTSESKSGEKARQ